MRIEQLVEEFLANCRLGRSPATVKFYRGRLAKFRKAFAEREFSTLTLSQIVAYLEAAGQECCDTTRRHNIVAIESLQKFALANGHLERPVFGKLPKPRIALREKIPTAEETAALLAKASAEFALIYAALRQSGARPAELCGAQIEQVETFERQPAIVLRKHKTAGKTGKPRVIPLGAKLKGLVRQAIGARKTGPIFLSPMGRQWSPGNLSAAYRELRNRAGLPKHLVLYLARHEHATQIYRKFGIGAAKEALGHSSINTTQRYVKVDFRDTIKHQDAFDLDAPKPEEGSIEPHHPLEGED